MKDVPYFSHDFNASQDPKIRQMRSVYGWQGYGWYWSIVEAMRMEDDYKLSMRGQYVWNAFAEQLQCDCNAAQKFINDCINEFHLLDSDDEYFWSNSLRSRMKKKDDIAVKNKAAADKRWADANAKRTQCKRNAKKVKESKVKEIDKNIIDGFVSWFNQEFGTQHDPAIYIDKITARLQKYTIDQLKYASLAMKRDTHMMGENDRKRVYATLEYITRSDLNVDKFLNRTNPQAEKDAELAAKEEKYKEIYLS